MKGCSDGSWGGSWCSQWFSTANGYGMGGLMWVHGSRYPEGVQGTVKTFDFGCARMLDWRDFRRTMGCCDYIWGVRLCSWCASTANRYGKEGQMWVKGSRDSEWVQCTITMFYFELARLLDGPDFRRMMGCCDYRWGSRWCSWFFSTNNGYGKEGLMWVNGSESHNGSKAP